MIWLDFKVFHTELIQLPLVVHIADEVVLNFCVKCRVCFPTFRAFLMSICHVLAASQTVRTLVHSKRLCQLIPTRKRPAPYKMFCLFFPSRKQLKIPISMWSRLFVIAWRSEKVPQAFPIFWFMKKMSSWILISWTYCFYFYKVFINLVLVFSLEVSVDASHVILGFLRTREAENHRVMWAGNVLERFSIESEHFAALHIANAKFSEILWNWNS